MRVATRASVDDVLTQAAVGATRIVVVDNPEPALLILHGIPDQNFDAGAQVRFDLPQDAFAHTRQAAVVHVSAQLLDGRPLPPWLRFDAGTGRFEGRPPADAGREIAIRVIARDGDAREAATIFRIRFTGEARAPGRTGLSEQIRTLAQRPAALERLSTLERAARAPAGARR